MERLKVVISGGGTGGHIFPAISIANAIRELDPEADILFVGAEGRMEMQRVPAAGYRIIGLPIRGLIRPLWKPGNISVLLGYLRSKRIIKKKLCEFAPHVAVGVGGYASAATLDVAHALGIPCLIQEQNSYAGLTNKSLARKADRICVAYEGMERFFPKDKIMLTGNPVRQSLLDSGVTREQAARQFCLSPEQPVILLIGGSLGARTMNESVLANLDRIAKSNVQFIWQTGSYYKESIAKSLEDKGKPANLYVTDFISQMDEAYTLADLVISRAGASSISELCLLGKPSILVPSPNVAEDHQTHNAMALVRKDAAILIADGEAGEKMMKEACALLADAERRKSMEKNIALLERRDAARAIADEVYSLLEK